MNRAFWLILLLGCGKENHHFPGSTLNATYPNGHWLALNNADMASVENDLLIITNNKRQELGLRILLPNATLDAIARGHSAHMEEHQFYAHENPEGYSPTARIRLVCDNVPFTAYENIWIMAPTQTAQDAFDAFWNSPDHKAALLSDTELIGIGMWRGTYLGLDMVYVTMEFLHEY